MEINQNELKTMFEQIDHMGKEDWDNTIASQRPKNPTTWKIVEVIRKRNLEQFKEIIAKIGWPKKSETGIKTVFWSWYIAQHSDLDIPFQEHCLTLMTALPKEETEPYLVAYLTDRVRTNKGENQLYGTQGRADEQGVSVILPVEDPAKLEERQKEMGLNETYEDYVRRIGIL